MADNKTATERPPLNTETIVAAAIAIADEQGVGKLSMRNLARSLGYEVMSLYNHVANKDQLLALMLDAVAEEITEPIGLEPMEAIRAGAVSTHELFLRHRWVPDLWLRHVPGPARSKAAEDLLRLLDASGLDEELAHYGFHAVNNHVLGHSMQQIEMTMGMEDHGDSLIADYVSTLSSDAHPHMLKHIDQHLAGEEGNSFELVLDLILDGLVRLNAER